LIYYDSTWVEIGHSANIANFIADSDVDTKIQVEESSDEDIIRFDVAGVEKAVLNSSGLSVTGNISTDGATVATTGKAIAMAMVFGG
jgi:hypothetical protein